MAVDHVVEYPVKNNHRRSEIDSRTWLPEETLRPHSFPVTTGQEARGTVLILSKPSSLIQPRHIFPRVSP
jgi:hypothetical protein